MLRDYLFDKNPYEGFDVSDYTPDITGFLLPTSVLDQIVRIRPRRIIEVGTWKGNSAIYMANLLRDHSIECEIVCVDTWLGSIEMWRRGDRDFYGRHEGLEILHGYPTMYYQFLANVILSGHQDRITPMPMTSRSAAQLLREIGYKADFIYLDGSHEYDDIIADLQGYWPILEDGGMLCGDDREWEGVGRALREFSKTAVFYEDSGWSILKVLGSP